MSRRLTAWERLRPLGSLPGREQEAGPMGTDCGVGSLAAGSSVAPKTPNAAAETRGGGPHRQEERGTLAEAELAARREEEHKQALKLAVQGCFYALRKQGLDANAAAAGAVRLCGSKRSPGPANSECAKPRRGGEFRSRRAEYLLRGAADAALPPEDREGPMHSAGEAAGEVSAPPAMGVNAGNRCHRPSSALPKAEESGHTASVGSS